MSNTAFVTPQDGGFWTVTIYRPDGSCLIEARASTKAAAEQTARDYDACIQPDLWLLQPPEEDTQ